MKMTPWLVILCLVLVACSGSKSAQKVDEQPPQIELSDADEFIENPADAPMDADALDFTNESLESTDVADTGLSNGPVIADEAPVFIEESFSPEVVTTSSVAKGTMREYTVQKNETLMMIAFKLYGDYGKWKSLAATNSKALNGGNNVRAGMKLKYAAPATAFVWNPQGLPYLIRTGDTLMRISNNVYNSHKKWKSIWNNNKPLIKDPNKIFSGFTIYYLENGREVASEI
jgi:nucleoid-associated protein YgaU